MARRVVTLILASMIPFLIVAGCGDDDDSTSSTPVEPGYSWTARSTGTTDYILDIAVAGTGFTAVGENGMILTSQDGVTLSRSPVETERDLFGVTSFDGGYVVVGDSLTVLTSSSPTGGFSEIDLSGLGLDADTWLYGTVSNDSSVIAIGHAGTIVRSTDGSSWATPDSQYTPFNLYGGAWSDTRGKYVIVGAGGLIMTSADGLEWEIQSSGTSAYLYDVVWAEELSQFIACGQHGTILTSPEGNTWQMVESRPDAYLYGLAWSGTQLVLVGQDGWLLTSPDVASFTLRPGPDVDLRGVEWSPERQRFVMVGNLQTIATSTDGASWDDLYDGISVDIQGVKAYFGETDTSLMAVGSQGTILRSDDGLEYEFVWARDGLQLNDLARTSSTAVAVGNLGYVLRSQDFKTWDTVATRPTFLDLNSVSVSSSRFVAVGDNGTIVESPDGATWNDVSLTNELSLYDVIWDGDSFLAVGDSGLVTTSSDGQTWSVQHIGAGADSLRGITQIGDTGYVAVGLSGALYYSADGSTWTAATWDEDNKVDLMAVTASDETVVACGLDGYRILSTDAGLTWQTIVSGTASTLRDVTWDGTRFIAVGDDIYLLTSP